ncbi:hypothetical protein RZE82_01645 [Mollicutes bacterium LVI A0039]|nr:hypothetical protein RZE82_01645 [Mollicutes bacterium LVI A0039]
MSYFDRLLHFYSLLIDEAYELEADFDLKKARHIRKSLVQKQRQVTKLIHDYQTSLSLVEFNNNTETEATIENQLLIMQSISEFNTTVLKIDVVTPKGYYMFIKDIIAYSHLLP